MCINDVDYLRNLRRWDAVKDNKLNDEVANPVLNPTIGTFDPLGLGALVVFPDPVNRFLNCAGTRATWRVSAFPL